MKTVDWVRLSTYLSGTSLTVLMLATIKVFPMYATQVGLIVAAIVFCAGFVTNVFANKTGAPATSIVVGAPIVPQGTNVTGPETLSLGTNTVTPHSLLDEPTVGASNLHVGGP
jgi:hypothetical protein